MTLTELASVGSFISGIAVVVTLALLLLQMRQTNRNQKALIQQGRSTKVIAGGLRQSELEMSEICIRATQADTAMTAAEINAFVSFGSAMFWTFEDSFLQHQAGLLDTPGWEADVATLRAFLTSPAYRAAWKMSRHMQKGAYRDFIDALIRDVKVIQPYDLPAVWNALIAEELAAA